MSKFNGQHPTTRKQCDFTKLITAGYELELTDGNTQDFHVTFHGPPDTAYETGIWKVHVLLPEDYPFGSPSIGFVNKILHPNIDAASGSVCLDVINQTWTPIYSLVNVFDIFLPQLLTYPNAADPLNAEAASLLMKDKVMYEKKIREYVQQYASKEAYLKQRSIAEDPAMDRQDASTSTCATATSPSECPKFEGAAPRSPSVDSLSVASFDPLEDDNLVD